MKIFIKETETAYRSFHNSMAVLLSTFHSYTLHTASTLLCYGSNTLFGNFCLLVKGPVLLEIDEHHKHFFFYILLQVLQTAFHFICQAKFYAKFI